MESLIEKFALVVLGWTLGLFSPILAGIINKRLERKYIINVLSVELDEIKFKLLTLAYMLSHKTGNFNRKFLEWIHSSLKQYAGINSDPLMLDEIERQLSLGEQEFAGVGSLWQDKDGTRLHLKKISTTLLDDHSVKLFVLDKVSLQLVSEIRTKFHLINEEIDQYRYYYNLTFSSNISENNYGIINKNMDDSYVNISAQSRLTVDLIAKLLKKWR